MEPSKLSWINEEEIASSSEHLWHYTRSGVLTLIANSGGLRCSDFRATNDALEFKAIKNDLSEAMAAQTLPLLRSKMESKELYLRGLDSPEELAKITLQDAQTLFDVMLKAMPLPPQLACFTTHVEPHHKENGLLTLWRSYASDGDGIALGFNARALVDKTEEALESSALNLICLSRVLYARDQIADRVAQASELLEVHANHVLAVLKAGTPKQPTYAAYTQFLILCAGAKHPDFEDEREVRLLVQESFPEDAAGRSPVRKIGAGILIECLDCLERVMIGPSDRQDDLVREIATVLAASGLSRVKVAKSNTPYRRVR